MTHAETGRLLHHPPDPQTFSNAVNSRSWRTIKTMVHLLMSEALLKFLTSAKTSGSKSIKSKIYNTLFVTLNSCTLLNCKISFRPCIQLTLGPHLGQRCKAVSWSVWLFWHSKQWRKMKGDVWWLPCQSSKWVSPFQSSSISSLASGNGTADHLWPNMLLSPSTVETKYCCGCMRLLWTAVTTTPSPPCSHTTQDSLISFNASGTSMWLLLAWSLDSSLLTAYIHRGDIYLLSTTNMVAHFEEWKSGSAWKTGNSAKLWFEAFCIFQSRYNSFKSFWGEDESSPLGDAIIFERPLQVPKWKIRGDQVQNVMLEAGAVCVIILFWYIRR